MFVAWPTIFLSIALFLNLEKWIYYIIFVTHFKDLATKIHMSPDGHRLSEKQVKGSLDKKKLYLNAATIVCICTILIVETVYSARTCKKGLSSYDDWTVTVLSPTYSFFSWLYGILALAFVCTGVLFLRVIKRDHLSFYNEYRSLLIAAITIQVVPLILRCFFDIMQNTKRWHSMV